MARNTVPRTCENCGKGFRAHVNDVAKGWGRFCSKQCRTDGRRRDPVAFFWSNVEKTETCWLWRGQLDNKGYGTFKIGTKPILVHRFSYELHAGGILPAMCVLHRCDVPNCVRPEHLFLGTKSDNNADCYAKGRQAKGDRNGSRLYPWKRPRGERMSKLLEGKIPKGSAHPQAKLTDEQAGSIRERYAAGGVSQQALADEYGVSQHCVSSVVRHKRYTKVSLS